jgi:hypothetical protein
MWLVAALVLVGAATVQAVPYETLDGRTIDLELVAGSGQFQSVLLLDFREGADDYYAFGYQWDAPVVPTGRTMIEAIEVASGGRFDADLTDWGWGWSLDRIHYTDDGGGMHVTPDWPVYMVDGALTLDTFVMPDDDPADEGLGMILYQWGFDLRELQDRSFDGWVTARFPEDFVGFDYAGPPPRIPYVAGDDVPIPEPATLALVAAGTLALRRRRVHARRSA